MEPNWTGPYVIHEVKGKGTYRLRNKADPTKVLTSLYNATRLKLYYDSSDGPKVDDLTTMCLTKLIILVTFFFIQASASGESIHESKVCDLHKPLIRISVCYIMYS